MSTALGQAQQLLKHPPSKVPGLWERAVVLLTRQALEASLDTLWDRRSPDLRGAPLRAQLLCLGEFVSPTELAGEVAHLWAVLSTACHYEAYNLTPSSGEVALWVEQVARLCAAIDLRAASP